MSFWTSLGVFLGCLNVVLDLKVGMLACSSFFHFVRCQVSLLLALQSLTNPTRLNFFLFPTLSNYSFYAFLRDLTSRNCFPFCSKSSSYALSPCRSCRSPSLCSALILDPILVVFFCLRGMEDLCKTLPRVLSAPTSCFLPPRAAF